MLIMKKVNYIGRFAAVLFTLALVGACSEDTMDGINKYDRYPLDVQTQFLLPDVIVRTADRTVGGDFNLYASVYVEHEGGVHNQLYNAEIRSVEPISASTYNNTWNGAYRALANARTLIKRTTEGGDEAGSKVTEGIGRILLAYNGAVLTDVFGDTPYSEAGVKDEVGMPVYRMPKIDKQEDIYADVFKQLDEAIALLETGETGPIGLAAANDYIYRAEPKKWIQVAYGLKARYTMRLLNKSANKEADLKNILTYIDKAFPSALDQFSMGIYDGTTQMNPFAAFSYARYALGISKSFLDKLTQRNDPRANQLFIHKYPEKKPVSDLSQLIIVPNGDIDNITIGQQVYSRFITDVASNAPVHLMSYHKLLFLKAEAYARLGEKDNAETALKEAMIAGFANLSGSIEGAYTMGDISELPENFDLSKDVCLAYYDAEIKTLFDANPLKEIMLQKYLAMNGANCESLEIYNDVRRLMGANENFITLANPQNAQNMFPHRYVYGNSDRAVNPEIEALVGNGQYVYTEKVWWAGGSR